MFFTIFIGKILLLHGQAPILTSYLFVTGIPHTILHAIRLLSKNYLNVTNRNE